MVIMHDHGNHPQIEPLYHYHYLLSNIQIMILSLTDQIREIILMITLFMISWPRSWDIVVITIIIIFMIMIQSMQLAEELETTGLL